jgi:predicted TIM-barrel fold metal-dependent hydrolase
MIDAHIHVVPPNLPGVGSLSPLLEGPLPLRAEALRQEMQAAGVEQVLAMGSWNAPPDDPLGIEATMRVAEAVPGLHPVGVADPERADPDHLHRVAAVLATGRVRALKAYLGYLHVAPTDPRYVPYYELAERYGLPMIFHTGDTYSPRAKLRFAHPLGVDEVAVDHPGVRFVLAHCGNPWLIEAAEVIYKNVNVWADLSGLWVGDAESLTVEERRETQQDLICAVQQAFRYAERPNRFLFGSDWPLTSLLAYSHLIRAAVPEVHHSPVFNDNARHLFHL